ncbi:MAG: thymidine phosphorylase, partial [Fidelibacterota bacterium]
MIPSELIIRKRSGEALTPDELQVFIAGFLNQSIPDYQMAALLMAIFFRGMDPDETIALTQVMIDSGERMNFGDLPAFPADKHSTGGVGDKISLILGPLLAAAGLAIPMISGRSLGHTGGTLDKLESIPGFNVNQSLSDFRRLVETVGIGMIGQTGEICPADQRMYALRDVTGTVESVPLIGSSIMSKKIAEGIRGLVIDLKTGSGAFMKTLQAGRALGKVLQTLGAAFGVRTDVVYTNMNQPLGRFAGVWCEVLESVTVLNGGGPEDTRNLTLELGARLMIQAGIAAETDSASLHEMTLTGLEIETVYKYQVVSGGLKSKIHTFKT